MALTVAERALFEVLNKSVSVFIAKQEEINKAVDKNCQFREDHRAFAERVEARLKTLEEKDLRRQKMVDGVLVAVLITLVINLFTVVAPLF